MHFFNSFFCKIQYRLKHISLNKTISYRFVILQGMRLSADESHLIKDNEYQFCNKNDKTLERNHLDKTTIPI